MKTHAENSYTTFAVALAETVAYVSSVTITILPIGLILLTGITLSGLLNGITLIAG